MHNTLLHIIVF